MAGVGKFRLAALLTISMAGASVAGENPGSATIEPPDKAKVVRLAVVITPYSSGLLDYLLPDFEQQSGYSVKVYSGNNVYDRARAGEADIVISHYGKNGISSFVLDGYGSWPKMVFSNQSALIGHKSDPANVRGLKSVAEALNQIATSQAPFVHNNSRSVAYLTETMLESIGQPERGGWFRDEGRSNAATAMLAEELRGYFIWGAVPFLRFVQQHDSSELEILVAEDPGLQRIMAATLVSEQKIQGINSAGAKALLAYLLAPATQAKIAAFREPGIDLQLWWPAGRDN